jgi:phosphate transport system substrate-binding protein
MHYPPSAFLLVITLLAASWTLFSYENNLVSAAPDHASQTSHTAQTRVKGRMTIVASDAVKPLISVLAAKFLRKHPEVTIAVQGAGASRSTPVDAFITGHSRMRRGDGDTTGHMGSYDAELLALPRGLTEDELRRFTAKHRYAPTGLVIAYGALAVYVNRDNPVKKLTLAEIDAIFSSTRTRRMQNIRAWGQLGLSGTWAHAQIHLYGLDRRTRGIRAFFKHVALLDGEFKPDVKTEPGSASLVVALEKDRYGIGYGLTRLETSAVRALSLSEKPGTPGVRPTTETVRSGQYPLSRSVYLYINRDPDEEWDAEIRELIHFIHSGDGQEIVSRAGWYTLPASLVASNLEMLEAQGLTTGAPSPK